MQEISLADDKSSGGAQLKKTPRPSQSDTEIDIDAKQMALHIAESGLDKKALNIEIIDVRGKVDYTDFVVVMSGRSDRQVSAIAKGIQQDLKHKYGVMCMGVEGLTQGNWVLIDFSDVVVHVFHQDTRGYYDLEALWLDAARVEFDSPESEFTFP